jgi:hypothetical protein
VTFLVGLIWPLILYLVTKKSCAVALPLCPGCRRRWKQATAAGVAAVLWVCVAVVLLVVGIAREDAGLGWFAFLSLLTVPTLVQFLVVRPRTITPRLIEGQRMWLRDVHPTALVALEREAAPERVLGTTFAEG